MLDARPPGLDLKFRPGTTITLTANWAPAGTLTGRTFTGTIGRTNLVTPVSVVGDVMTIVVTDTETALYATQSAVHGVEFALLEDIAGTPEPIIVGRWRPSNVGTPSPQHSVNVTQGEATVAVTVSGIAGSTGDLVVAGDLTVGGTFTAELPLIFWQHGTAQTIPNATWTPVPWNSRLLTVGEGWSTYMPASTTIAAGSNGQALPQGTINVASTTGFATATSTLPRYLVITIGGTHRMVMYTGITATQFTGCTLGVGTMTTGDAVAQANVEITMPTGTVGPLVAEIAWASNATGGRWTRLRGLDVFAPGVHFNGGTGYTPAGIAIADPAVRSVCNEQPAWNSSAPRFRIEVHQTSTGNLDTVLDQGAAPRLVIQALSAIDL